MFICLTCESIFPEPEAEYISEEDGYGEVCPYCGSTDFVAQRDADELY